MTTPHQYIKNSTTNRILESGYRDLSVNIPAGYELIIGDLPVTYSEDGLTIPNYEWELPEAGGKGLIEYIELNINGNLTEDDRIVLTEKLLPLSRYLESCVQNPLSQAAYDAARARLVNGVVNYGLLQSEVEILIELVDSWLSSVRIM